MKPPWITVGFLMMIVLVFAIISFIVLSFQVPYVESHCVRAGVRAYQSRGWNGQLVVLADPTCKEEDQ